MLGGHTRVADPGANFRNAFEKLEGGTTAYGITNALYKIVFAYAGYTNAFNMVNEVKVSRVKSWPVLVVEVTSLRERLSELCVRIRSSNFDEMDSFPSSL